MACVVCGGREYLRELFTPYEGGSVYADMIAQCYDMQLTLEAGVSHICYLCSSKLTDALVLKQQLLEGLDRIKAENENKFVTNLAAELIPTEDDPKVEKKRPIRRAPQPKVNGAKKQRTRHKEVVPFELHPEQTKCEYCGEDYVTFKALNIHMNCHFPNFVCKDCGKGYASNSRLRKHAKSHVEGQFICDLCNKVFKNTVSLSSHVSYKHTNKLPYKCRVCDVRFATKYKRIFHMKSEHGVAEPEYKCAYCGRSFCTSGDRTKHVQQTHEKQRKYPCPYCERTFEFSYRLNYHLRDRIVNPSDVKYQCGDCGEEFTRTCTLQHHLSQHTEPVGEVGGAVSVEPELLKADGIVEYLVV